MRLAELLEQRQLLKEAAQRLASSGHRMTVRGEMKPAERKAREARLSEIIDLLEAIDRELTKQITAHPPGAFFEDRHDGSE